MKVHIVLRYDHNRCQIIDVFDTERGAIRRKAREITKALLKGTLTEHTTFHVIKKTLKGFKRHQSLIQVIYNLNSENELCQ